MHDRNVNDRKDTIKGIKKVIRKKQLENAKLDQELEELALSVAERRNVNEMNGNEFRFSLSRSLPSSLFNLLPVLDLLAILVFLGTIRQGILLVLSRKPDG